MAKAYPKISNEVLSYINFLKNELNNSAEILYSQEEAINYLNKTVDFITVIFLKNKEGTYHNSQTQNINV